ncbi:MAG: SPOR domain-containing protein [Gemmatimonadales bacterium]
MRRTAISASLLLAALAVHAEAQVVTSADTGASRADSAISRPANDSLFRRARRFVSEGNGVAGRALVDSLLAAADPATPQYGDALYWHGAIAPTAAEAERDYRRVIVEYPLAYYSGDALLAIAELEQARGDRTAAMQHLQRFVREHPANPGRGIAALGVARLAFEQGDSTVGCAMLAEARASVAATDVELHNQIDYFSGRCRTAPAAPPRVATAVAPAPEPTVPARLPVVASPPVSATRAPVAPTVQKPNVARRRDASPPPARPRMVTSYTVQVAAYDTRADAERLVARLSSRGIRTRVSGTSKPFRVRLPFYRTRQEATTEAMALKKRGIVGFVTEEAHPVAASSP